MTPANNFESVKDITAEITRLMLQMQATAAAKQQLQYQVIQSLKQFEADLENFTKK